MLFASGLFMGLVNANLTDLALGLGGSDRRIATGAFNLVRWGAAAPAPIIAGKLAETSLALPYWVGFGVLAVGRDRLRAVRARAGGRLRRAGAVGAVEPRRAGRRAGG